MSKSVTFFEKIGVCSDKTLALKLFNDAFKENQDYAIRIMLWLRDIREGQGRRTIFRELVKSLIKTNPELAKRILLSVPELGRWDDVFVYFGTQLENDALRLIEFALQSDNALCAKWMPRPNGSATNKALANTIRKHLKITPKEYRKLLVEKTSVVETLMCSKQWDKITYEHVPSVASSKYQSAFAKNDNLRYAKYLKSLEKGETKVNAGALYPYDIIRKLKSGVNATLSNAQWKALPNFMGDGKHKLLPVIDVSGSMDCPVGGLSGISCMDAAISLGLYMSERLTSVYQNKFITFSTRPSFVDTSKWKDISDKYYHTKRADWGGSTDIQKTFELILDAAIKNKLSQDDLPTILVILSDMQFNSSDRSYNSQTPKKVIKRFADAGYVAPRLVFWNLRGTLTTQVNLKSEASIEVSGLSPSLMKSILSLTDLTFNPEDAMLEVILNSRYDY